MVDPYAITPPPSQPVDTVTQADSPGMLSRFLRRAAVGVTQIPTTPLALYGLANLGQRYFTGANIPGGEAALSAVQGYDRRVRDWLGVPAPETWDEFAQEAVGNVLTGQPVAVASQALGRVGSAAVRGMFVVPRTAPGMAADVVAQTGGGMALHAMLSPPPPPDPYTVAPTTQVQPAQAGTDPYAVQLIQPPSQPQSTQGDPYATSPLSVAGAGDPYAVTGASAAPAPTPAPASDDSGWSSILLPIGVALGVATATAAGVRMIRGTPRLRTDPNAQLTGINDPQASALLPVAENIRSRLVDEAAAFVGPVQRGSSQTTANAVRQGATLDWNPHAVNQRVQHAWETGDYEGLVRVGTSGRAYTASYSRLTPQQQSLLDDSLAAADALNDIATGKISQVSMGGGRTLQSADLQDIVTRAQADPVVSRMANEFRELINAPLNNAMLRGVLSVQDFHTIINNNPSYYPHIMAQRTNLWNRIMNTAPTVSDKDALEYVRHLMMRTGHPGGVLMKSPDALEQYTSALMRFANVNSVRRSALDALANTTHPGLMGTVRFVRSVPPNSSDIITVMDVGRLKHYQVTDPIMLRALQGIPHQLSPFTDILNLSRRIFQTVTTGAGAPGFSPIGLSYEVASAAFTAPRGTRFGYLPGGGDIVGGMVGSLIGVGRGWYGYTVRNTAEALQDAWRNHTGIARILGDSTTKMLADRMARAYAKSTFYMMNRTGALATGGRFINEPGLQNVHSLLDMSNPRYASRSPRLRQAYETWKDVLGLMQSGARIHFFAANVRKHGPRRTAELTRTLAGDPGVRGGAAGMQQFISAVPYSNIAVQEGARWYQAMRQNGLGNSAYRLAIGAALPGFLAAWAANRLGPEYEDHFYRGMTPEQQARLVPLYTDGIAPLDTPMVPMHPTGRIAYAMGREAFAAMNGIGVEGNLGGQSARMWDNMLAAFMSAQPVALPPLVNAGIAATGNQFRVGGGRMQLTPMRGERLTGEEGQFAGLPPDASALEVHVNSEVLRGIMTGLLGSAGAMGVDSARSMFMATRGGRDASGVIHEGAASAAMHQQRTAVPLNQILWNTPQRVSVANSDWHELQGRLGALKDISDTYQQNIRGAGRVGSISRGEPNELAGEIQRIADPAMLPMMMRIANFHNTISRVDLSELNTLRERMDVAISNPRVGVRVRDEDRQVAVRDLVDRQRELLRKVRDFEQMLSLQYNVRVNLRQINRNTRLEDMEPL